MKWSINKNLAKIAMGLMVFLALGSGWKAQAQTQEQSQSKSVSITTTEDGKVKLKVTMKEGNDTRNFEKTYDSYEDIQADPDLEKYGIDLDAWNFGGATGASGPTSFMNFRSMPGMPSWDDDDNNFFMFDFDTDSIGSRIQEMMKDHFQGNRFYFNFGDGDNPFMSKMDSLQSQFHFNFDDGKMFFNGDEFMNMDSLQQALKDRFGAMQFDFDFDNWDNLDKFPGWNSNEEETDNGFRVISRSRVYVRSANEDDKALAGSDKMEDLAIKDISFYPNPSDGKFNLELATAQKGAVQVKIISPTGKKVFDKTNSAASSDFEFNIDISDQDEGVYVLQVIQNNKVLTKRIIIE